MAYQDYECEISKSRLGEVFAGVSGPACLLGGWAVFLTVNERFSREHGREYSGSRDIDIGFHVDPRWSKQDLARSAIAQSSRILEGAGFTETGSRFVMNYDIGTKAALTPEQPGKSHSNRIFELYVDPMADNEHADAREVIGFPPIVEPRLTHVFDGGEYAPVEELGCRFALPSPWILAAAKTSSMEGRIAYHKRHKDVSDLYAVLMHSGAGYDGIRQRVRESLGEEKVARAVGSLGDDDYEGASLMCGAPKEDIEAAVSSLAP